MIDTINTEKKSKMLFWNKDANKSNRYSEKEK